MYTLLLNGVYTKSGACTRNWSKSCPNPNPQLNLKMFMRRREGERSAAGKFKRPGAININANDELSRSTIITK